MGYLMPKRRVFKRPVKAGLGDWLTDWINSITGSSSPDTSTLFPGADVTSTPSTPVTGESVPVPAQDASQTAGSVRGMQHAINRYFGQLTGSPIGEDNSWGAETSGALSTISSALPGIGYTDEARLLLALTNARSVGGITDLLNKVANQQNWLYDAGGVSSSPVASGAGPRALNPTSVTPANGIQASLNSLASTFGLPTWGLAVGAVAVGYFAVSTAKKTRRMARTTRRYR